MDNHIPGGSFVVARQLFDSAIWTKPPLYLKIWIWIIGQANYAKREKNGRIYKRGSLVTTYHEIIRETSHHHNRSHIVPTVKQIRIILKWLQSENMILAKPLKSGLDPTGADTTARTRAYSGLKIIVINYDVYQSLENYKGRHQGRDLSQQGHNNNKENKEKKNTPEKSLQDFPDPAIEIESLISKYPHPKIIHGAINAIATTRKTGKVANSIVLAQLKRWAKYPTEQVEGAIELYIDKDYAGDGKGENYLFGIIRNHKVKPKSKTPEWL